MILIAGLGNPGIKYINNRHNVGHMFIDFLKNTLTKEQMNQITLRKTSSFMNESGTEIKKWSAVGRDLYVAHDDLDIPLGMFKITIGKGPQLHNGLDSIDEALGTKDYYRIRIGVENRGPENRIPGETYVLQDFTEMELQKLKTIFPLISQRLLETIRINRLPV